MVKVFAVPPPPAAAIPKSTMEMPSTSDVPNGCSKSMAGAARMLAAQRSVNTAKKANFT